mgnify:CR=1 FL=1
MAVRSISIVSMIVIDEGCRCRCGEEGKKKKTAAVVAAATKY